MNNSIMVLILSTGEAVVGEEIKDDKYDDIGVTLKNVIKFVDVQNNNSVSSAPIPYLTLTTDNEFTFKYDDIRHTHLEPIKSLSDEYPKMVDIIYNKSKIVKPDNKVVTLSTVR